MRQLDSALRRLHRVLALGPAAPPSTHRSAPVQPEPPRPSRRRGLLGVAAAVALPLGFGLGLVPLREQLSQSTSLLMVLPVFVVAVVAGPRLGTVAALSGAAAFDVLHTEPFYRPTIDDPDDVIETIVLLVIGVTIGYLAQSAQRAVFAAGVRRHALEAMTDFLGRIGTPISDEELAGHAGASICGLLEAQECRWRPGYMGTAGPVLQPDGTLSGVLTIGVTGGGVLPTTIEIPVGSPPTELGRFIVRTAGRSAVALEERRAAATVAATLARCIEA